MTEQLTGDGPGVTISRKVGQIHCVIALPFCRIISLSKLFCIRNQGAWNEACGQQDEWFRGLSNLG